MTARLFTLDPLEGFRPKTFAGHKDAVLGAYFSSDAKTVRDLFDRIDVSQRPADLYGQPRRRGLHVGGQAYRRRG